MIDTVQSSRYTSGASWMSMITSYFCLSTWFACLRLPISTDSCFSGHSDIVWSEASPPDKPGDGDDSEERGWKDRKVPRRTANGNSVYRSTLRAAVEMSGNRNMEI